MAEHRLPWWRKAMQLAIGGLRSLYGRLQRLGDDLFLPSDDRTPISVVPSWPFELVRLDLMHNEPAVQRATAPDLQTLDPLAAPQAAEALLEPEADAGQTVTAASAEPVELEAQNAEPEEVVIAPELAQPEAAPAPVFESVVELVPEPISEPILAAEPTFEEIVAPLPLPSELQSEIEAEVIEDLPADEPQPVSVAEPVEIAAIAPELVQPEAAPAPVFERVAELVPEPVSEPILAAEPTFEEIVAPLPLPSELQSEIEAEVIEDLPADEPQPVSVAEPVEIAAIAPELVQPEAAPAPVFESVAETIPEPVAEPILDAELTIEEAAIVEEAAVESMDSSLEPLVDPDPAEVAAVCAALERNLEVEPVAPVAEKHAPDPLDEEDCSAEPNASAQVLAAPAFIAYFAAPSAAGSRTTDPPAGEIEPTEEPAPVAAQEPPSREEAMQLEPSGCEESEHAIVEPPESQDGTLEEPPELTLTDENEDPEPEAEPQPEPEPPTSEPVDSIAEPESEMALAAMEVTDSESMKNEAVSSAEVQIKAASETVEPLAGQSPAELVSAGDAEVALVQESVPDALPAPDETQETVAAADAPGASEEPTELVAEHPLDQPALDVPAAELDAEEVTSEPDTEEAPAPPSNLLQMPNPAVELLPVHDAEAALAPVKQMIRRDSDDATPFSILVDKVYDGPMDLLLDLIRKQDIDIYDIPISKITAQFLAYVEKLKATDVDSAGEFIYMASLLIHIKSKMLLPRAPSGPDDAADDPRRELVERLLEHERFKNAAQMLQEKQVLEAASWSNPGAKEFKNDEGVEAEIAADTTDLVRVFRSILERARKRPVFNVSEDQVTVGQMLQFLSRRLTMEDKPISLRRLLSNSKSERALICSFLALLELVRLQAILLRQDSAFSEIFIKKHTAFDAVISEALANAHDDWQ